ncbi:hypothetical protein [Marinomonas atlantica]|uniref:hypothetical protein n=1 Tax=Marinomonas atlantica TaxID=1806668 RepID=UPI000832188D|nr:hypothetical protein [Marinomonas atlantica]MCO4785098.1 hypothetical protein [Marinomonas atlantica]
MNFKTPAMIATLTLAASATFAAGDNNLQDDYLDAQSHAKAISAQLETMGVDTNPNVEFNSPTTLSQKVDAYEEKIDTLQSQYNMHSAQ